MNSRTRASIGLAAAVVAVVVALVLVTGRGAESQPPGAPTGSQASRAPAQLGDAAFWQLIAATRGAAGKDTARQSELLQARLARLSPQATGEFARTRRRLDQAAYTWSVWGAALMIEDGCSDDCFRNFRAYLISLGRGPYEQALGNPDSLAAVIDDRQTGAWEKAADAAYPSVSGEPRGMPFNEDDAAGLARRYPRLAARFR
jgi:hypothetical protein